MRKSELNLMFNNVKIDHVTEHNNKHLGVVLSDDLKLSKHIILLCLKASKKIGLYSTECISMLYWAHILLARKHTSQSNGTWR